MKQIRKLIARHYWKFWLKLYRTMGISFNDPDVVKVINKYCETF